VLGRLEPVGAGLQAVERVGDEVGLGQGREVCGDRRRRAGEQRRKLGGRHRFQREVACRAAAANHGLERLT
jgi:hypothetical protein